MGDTPTMLFDGTCNFCDGAVHFVLDHENGKSMRFAALQSDAAKELLTEALGEEKTLVLQKGASGSGDPDTLVLVEDGKVYTHSTGALRIARHLRWPWKWGFVFIVVPGFIRDAFYRWFARNRYRWFGKTEACRVPTPELRTRFLA
jgi:predicted DCC family thiol-disulfide oxidoreductase YuxK